jgi:hypothetical protein
VSLERSPLIVVSTIEELLGRKNSGSGTLHVMAKLAIFKRTNWPYRATATAVGFVLCWYCAAATHVFRFTAVLVECSLAPVCGSIPSSCVGLLHRMHPACRRKNNTKEPYIRSVTGYCSIILKNASPYIPPKRR